MIANTLAQIRPWQSFKSADRVPQSDVSLTGHDSVISAESRHRPVSAHGPRCRGGHSGAALRAYISNDVDRGPGPTSVWRRSAGTQTNTSRPLQRAGRKRMAEMAGTRPPAQVAPESLAPL